MNLSLLWLISTAALVGAGLCTPATAMALRSLTDVDTGKLEAEGWQVRKAAERLTLACGDCADLTATDVLLDSVSDGTEQRIRSGTTTAATMLDLCRKNAAAKGSECFDLREANLQGAVGFVTETGLGPMGFSSTYVLWQDGRRLTIRSVAPSRKKAVEVGKLMFKSIGSQVVD